MWEAEKTVEEIAAVYDSKNVDQPRKTVLTSYNNRSY